MFATVSVPFEAFQALPSATHRWLLTCFSRYVDKAGRAFPSLRQLGVDARMSLSSVSRHMAALERFGVFQRERVPGGRYRYTLMEAYRPRWPGRGVPAQEGGVSQGGRQQASLRSDSPNWEARLRGWHKRRMWLGWWGPKPSEPGCWVPPALLMGQRGDAVAAG